MHGRRARRDARHHLGAERRRQGHDHRRAAAPAARPGLPLRRDLHDAGAAARRGRRRRATTSSTPRRSRRCAPPASSSRRTRSTATGTARRASEVRDALAGRPRRDPQDRRPGRPGGQGAGPRGAARSSSSRRRSRTCSSACEPRATETADELELRQRNAAIELARQEDYDYVVTNETGQVERTAERIDEIIAEEHARHPDRRVDVYSRSP